MGQLGRPADREIGVTPAPPKLEAILRDFDHVDRNERSEMLIEWADAFTEVPPEVATRPFPEANHVQRCESEAYVWAVDRPDGTLQFHFAVENPQGISAKAWCAILADTASGAPLEQVAAIDPQSIFHLFGRDLSMGKGQGLMGVLDMVAGAARERLARRTAH